MQRLLVIAAVTAFAVARPETYREKEDFKYSRSSSDDGTKSGYYGAQRGNMGGNYERAHNMDSLAQNQMSGLVRQTQGELGDGAAQRSGSVYTAANSRGTYGSGHFDLSNLEGRNFQEGVAHGDSQSHSSLSSQSSGYGGHHHSSYNEGGYDSSNAYNSRYRGHNSAGNSDQMLYANVQQHNADDLQAVNQESHSSGYQSKYGYSSQSGYNQANLDSADRYGSNAQHSHRLVGVSAIPVRVVLRPGTRIAVPVAAETYDASHGSATYDATHHGSSTLDHNAINTEAESLSGNDQQVGYQPTNNGKHFESSYSYRKEWEKHHSQPQPSGRVPAVIPTINPYPQNSELYEDAQAHNTEQHEARGSESHNSHSSHRNYVKSGSSQQSSHQADYNSQQHSSASNADSSAYTLQHNNGAALSQVLNNQVENLNPKPKSYQSSYSYHKSWERQGDPYVIKPVSTSDDASQRLTSASSSNGAFSDSHQYGSQHRYGSHRKTYLNNGYEDCDCDENGHIRVARSYNSYPDHQQQEDLTQQTQQQWDRLEDVGQQTQNKWDKYEDLGQHTQNEDLTQQSQNRWEKIEDLGQQTENHWGNQQETVSHSNWDKFELEPQSQNTEQQTQNKWSTFETMKNEHSKHDEQKSTDYENTNPINTFNVGFNQNTENIHSYNNFELQKENNGDSVLGHHFQTTRDENKKQDSNIHNLGEQTQDQWDMFQSAFNTNHDEFKPAWHHSTNSYQTSNSYNKPNFNNGQSNNAWMNNQEQVVNNMYALNDYHHNLQSHFMTTPEQSWTVHTNADTIDKTHTSDSSLSSLWDKLDNIEKQSAASHGSEKVDHSTNQHADQTHTSTAFEHTYNDDKYFNTYNKETKHEVNLDDKISPTEVTSTATEKAKASGKSDNRQILHPQDIGRGDIGPEDSIISTDETIHVKPLQPTTRPYKTAEELEVLSLSKDFKNIATTTQKTTTSTQTNQHKSHHKNDFVELDVLNSDTTKQTETHNFEQQSQNADAQYEQQSNSFNQQHNGFYQQSLNNNKPETFMNQHSQLFEQELVPLQIEELSQHNKRENDEKHWEVNNEKVVDDKNFEQQTGNFELENIQQQTQNFEQQIGHFEHANVEQEPQNFEQQTGNFGQHSGNFEHEHLEQQIQNFELIGNMEQQTGNMEQQTGNFEQQAGNFEQQTGNFEQQTGNFEHENLEQQTQNFEQQTGNFEHENLEQQAQNFDQQTGKFEKENLEENSHNFKQQTGNFGHENLEQQTQNFKQQIGNFEHENLEQQNKPAWIEESQQQSERKLSVDLQKPDMDKFIHHTIPERIDQSNEKESPIVSKKIGELETIVERTNEQPGFWKSIGNKFVNAKDKVASWFKSR